MSTHFWQKPQWQFLMHAYAQNRLSHAYLLFGDDADKLEFAKLFSAFLLCEDKHKKNSACEKCRSCRWMKSSSHPDFIMISPEEKNHPIKIDNIRLLTQKINQTAQCGGAQVILISPAESIAIGAANALLKTLEEPTGNVLFLLIADQTYSIPATILSRCQKIFFLNQNKAMDLEQIHLRDAIIKNLNQYSYDAVFQKQDMHIVLSVFLKLLLDISKIQLSVKTDFLIYPDCAIILKKMAHNISTENTHQFIKLILEKKALISHGVALNQQLLMDSIFIQWERYTC